MEMPGNLKFRGFYSFSAALIVASLVACERRQEVGKSTEESSNGISGKVEQRPEPQSKTRLRDNLRGARTNADILAASLDEALSSGLIQSDPEVRSAYEYNLGRFSPEVLAKLTSAGIGFGGGMIPKLVANTKNEEFFKQYYDALATDLKSKMELMQHMGSDSPLFAPDRIEETLKGLSQLTDDELRVLGSGLASRVKLNSGDEGSKIDAINGYFSVISDPILLEKLAPAAVTAMKTDEAIAWLQKIAPEVSRYGDIALIQSLKPETYHQGFEFINNLIDNNQVPRAQKATETFLLRYAVADPNEAIKWVLSLDSSFVTPQMLTTSFLSLYRCQPENALRLLEGTEDPKRKALFERLIKQ
jgi:hypothetical protein